MISTNAQHVTNDRQPDSYKNPVRMAHPGKHIFMDMTWPDDADDEDNDDQDDDHDENDHNDGRDVFTRMRHPHLIFVTTTTTNRQHRQTDGQTDRQTDSYNNPVRM